VTKRTRTRAPGPSDANPTGLTFRAADQGRNEELRELLEQIREATRLAHEVLKDLRIESRRAQRLLPMIVTKRIKSEVDRQIEELGNEVQEHMVSSVALVERSIEGLYARLIGKDHYARKEGLLSLPEIIDDVAARRPLGDLPITIPLPLLPDPLTVADQEDTERRLRRVLGKEHHSEWGNDDEGISSP
jgi:hypothetical protein